MAGLLDDYGQALGGLLNRYGGLFGNVGAAMPEAYGANAPVMDPLAKAVMATATLPQRAMESSANMVRTGQYDPAPILEAAMLPMGTGAIAGVPMRAGEAVLGSGAVRKVPADNYLGPVSRYTDRLYREMSPSEALIDLPTSVSYGGGGPMGIARRFYADTPDLALGQGGNRGVRVEYDSAPFEGQINQKKPGWDYHFQNGRAEYVAAPSRDANIKDAVRGFEVDNSALSRVEQAQYQRLIKNLEALGWDVNKTSDRTIVRRPK